METCPKCGYSEAAKANKKFGTEMSEYTNPRNPKDKAVFGSRAEILDVKGMEWVRSDVFVAAQKEEEAQAKVAASQKPSPPVPPKPATEPAKK